MLIFEAVEGVLQNDLRRERVNDALALLSSCVGLVEITGSTHGGHTLVDHRNGGVLQTLAQKVGELAALPNPKTKRF